MQGTFEGLKRVGYCAQFCKVGVIGTVGNWIGKLVMGDGEEEESLHLR